MLTVLISVMTASLLPMPALSPFLEGQYRSRCHCNRYHEASSQRACKYPRKSEALTSPGSSLNNFPFFLSPCPPSFSLIPPPPANEDNLTNLTSWSQLKSTLLLTFLIMKELHSHYLYKDKTKFYPSTTIQRDLLLTLCILYIYIFFPFIFISWRLITLQYCSGFCHTLT